MALATWKGPAGPTGIKDLGEPWFLAGPGLGCAAGELVPMGAGSPPVLPAQGTKPAWTTLCWGCSHWVHVHLLLLP